MKLHRRPPLISPDLSPPTVSGPIKGIETSLLPHRARYHFLFHSSALQDALHHESFIAATIHCRRAISTTTPAIEARGKVPRSPLYLLPTHSEVSPLELVTQHHYGELLDHVDCWSRVDQRSPPRT
jgi:hypothetical protein